MNKKGFRTGRGSSMNLNIVNTGKGRRLFYRSGLFDLRGEGGGNCTIFLFPGTKINEIPRMGNPIPHLLYENGFRRVALTLIENGEVDANLAPSSGLTLLHLVAKHGTVSEARSLIRLGASKSALYNEKTPLKIAVDLGRRSMTKFLKS